MSFITALRLYPQIRKRGVGAIIVPQIDTACPNGQIIEVYKRGRRIATIASKNHWEALWWCSSNGAVRWVTSIPLREFALARLRRALEMRTILRRLDIDESMATSLPDDDLKVRLTSPVLFEKTGEDDQGEVVWSLALPKLPPGWRPLCFRVAPPSSERPHQPGEESTTDKLSEILKSESTSPYEP